MKETSKLRPDIGKALTTRLSLTALGDTADEPKGSITLTGRFQIVSTHDQRVRAFIVEFLGDGLPVAAEKPRRWTLKDDEGMLRKGVYYVEYGPTLHRATFVWEGNWTKEVAA